MFTTCKSRLAILGAALVLETAAIAEEPALPRPPLQPLPKEFKIPRPNLGVPDVIPVAQQSAPPRPSNPIPTKPLPEPKEAPPAAVIGAQAAQDGVAVTKSARVAGKIFRVDNDRVVVETNAGGQLTLHVDAKTEYLRRVPATGYAAMVPGAEFTAAYEQRGERLWITAIDIATNAESRASQPVPVPPTIPVAVAPYEGEIVRVVGPDQIIVRNLAGIELPIYMTPQTRYELGETAGAFGDLAARHADPARGRDACRRRSCPARPWRSLIPGRSAMRSNLFWYVVLLLSLTFVVGIAQSDGPKSDGTKGWSVHGAKLRSETRNKKMVFEVTPTRPLGFVWMDGLAFREGTIEVRLKGKGEFGVAYGTPDDPEQVVFAPANFMEGKTPSVSYVATNEPGKQPGKSNVVHKLKSPPNPDDWFDVKVDVKLHQVRIYVGEATEPCLTVERTHKTSSGKAGLCFHEGSKAEFMSFQVTPYDDLAK